MGVVEKQRESGSSKCVNVLVQIMLMLTGELKMPILSNIKAAFH